MSHNKAPSSRLSRRGFLNSIIMSWSALTASPFIYGIIKYIVPPRPDGKTIESIVAAHVSEIPSNTARIVRFNKRPVIIVHTTLGQFKAFSANCTHLGCVVEYRPDDQQFHCNCHGSVFDLNGNNIKGPANIPLPALKVTLEQSKIVVSQPAV